MPRRKWKLQGYDKFDGGSYSLPGSYTTEELAQKAARTRLNELNKSQPIASSGGQSFGGIQDEVWIIRPDGSGYRFTR